MAVTDRVYLHGRLSRADEREPGTLEEKVSLRTDILRRIAADHGYTGIPDERIVFELKSTALPLEKRPDMIALLDKCRSGLVDALVCFDVDRLTRNVSELQTILYALERHAVTLITQRDKYRIDRHFDPTLLEILAVLGGKERRSYSYRRQATNEQRAKRGERSQGYAPYGYRWDGTAKTHVTIPDEYAILEEIFRRIWKEGATRIAADLTKRYHATGHPKPPGHGRTLRAAAYWHQSTINRMVSNPFYAGMPAHRRRVRRDGSIEALNRHEWVQPDAELQYEHPITPEGYEDLRRAILLRKSRGAPKLVSDTLLVGLLFCPRGQPMRAAGPDSYGCDCRARGDDHPGRYVSIATMHALARHVTIQALSAVNPATVPTLPRANRGRLHKDLSDMRGQLAELSRAARNLMADSDLHRRVYGNERYEAVMRENAAQLAETEKRVGALEKQLDEPDMSMVLVLLRTIREVGVGDYYDTADTHDRRALLRWLLARIDLPEPKQKRVHHRAALVSVWPWLARYWPGGEVSLREVRPHYMSRK